MPEKPNPMFKPMFNARYPYRIITTHAYLYTHTMPMSMPMPMLMPISTVRNAHNTLPPYSLLFVRQNRYHPRQSHAIRAVVNEGKKKSTAQDQKRLPKPPRRTPLKTQTYHSPIPHDLPHPPSYTLNAQANSSTGHNLGPANPLATTA